MNKQITEQPMSYWQKWNIQVNDLKREIALLKNDEAYDIDRDHHKDRMRIIKQKEEELTNLIMESIPF